MCRGQDSLGGGQRCSRGGPRWPGRRHSIPVAVAGPSPRAYGLIRRAAYRPENGASHDDPLVRQLNRAELQAVFFLGGDGGMASGETDSARGDGHRLPVWHCTKRRSRGRRGGRRVSQAVPASYKARVQSPVQDHDYMYTVFLRQPIFSLFLKTGEGLDRRAVELEPTLNCGNGSCGAAEPFPQLRVGSNGRSGEVQ